MSRGLIGEVGETFYCLLAWDSLGRVVVTVSVNRMCQISIAVLQIATHLSA